MAATNGNGKSTDHDPPKGVFCPKCWCQMLRVLYTRHLRGGRTRRCRICRNCGKRFYTTETDVRG